MGASSAESTYHCFALITALIASMWLMRPIMISRLAAIMPAPSHTSSAFQRQIRSTTCPIGIFSAHGMPAQNSSAARNSGESSTRYSLTKKVPTIAVRPETPYAA